MLTEIPEPRVTILAALCGAIALAAMSVVFGYGWPALFISIPLGAAVGFWSALRMLAKRRFPSDASFGQLSRLQRRTQSGSRHAAREILSSHEIDSNSSLLERRADNFLHGLIKSLPKFQRWASAIFLLQAIISFVAIAAFWMAQSAGLDAQLIRASSFSEFFKESFPISPTATMARIRFDNLFIPLSGLYIVSLATFAVALLHSLVPLLRTFRKHGFILLGTAVFLAFFASFFFQQSDYLGASSLKRYVIDGNLWGYFGLFCVLPFLGIFLAAELPEER